MKDLSRRSRVRASPRDMIFFLEKYLNFKRLKFYKFNFLDFFSASSITFSGHSNFGGISYFFCSIFIFCLKNERPWRGSNLRTLTQMSTTLTHRLSPSCKLSVILLVKLNQNIWHYNFLGFSFKIVHKNVQNWIKTL